MKTKNFFRFLLIGVIIGVGVVAGYTKGAMFYQAFDNTVVPVNNVAIGHLMNPPALVSATATTTAGSLPTSTTFYFAITATDGTGQTIASNELSALTSSTASTNEIITKWAPVNGAKYYYVYEGRASQTYLKYATTTATTYTFATTTGLTVGAPDTVAKSFVNKIVATGQNLLNGDLSIFHIIGSMNATVALGTGAGSTTGAVSTTTYANDISGDIQITTGTSTATNATIASITFGEVYGKAPVCGVLPESATAAALTTGRPFAVSTATGTVITSNAVALATSTTYRWGYQCTN